MLIAIFVILILFCIFDYLRDKKISTPTFAFNFIWLFTLALYQLKLSYLQRDLSERTMLVFFTAIIAYNLSYLLFKYIIPASKRKESKKINLEENLKIAKWIVIAIFVVEVAYSGGFPLLWNIIGSSKNYLNYGIPSIHGAFNGFIICLGSYSIYKKRRDSLLYLGIGILIISRQVIISMFIEAIICLMIDFKNKIKLKKIFLYSVIVLALFTIIGNFRSGKDTMNNVFNPKPEYENLSDSTKWIYSYLTFSVSNFNNLTLITKGNINSGASMLKEVLPTVILNKANVRVKYSPFYLVSPNYTVSTYLPPIYLDFGIYGVAIFSIFMAFIGCLTNKNLMNKNNNRNKLMYAVFIHNILLLFFNNMFLYLPTIIQFIYIPIIFGGEDNENINNSSSI